MHLFLAGFNFAFRLYLMVMPLACAAAILMFGIGREIKLPRLKRVSATIVTAVFWPLLLVVALLDLRKKFSYNPAVRLLITCDGAGYWIRLLNGQIIPFGSAFAINPRDAAPVVARDIPMGMQIPDIVLPQFAPNGSISGSLGNECYDPSHIALAKEVLEAPIVYVLASIDGCGWWLLAANGRVYSYGNACWAGDLSAAPGGYGVTWRMPQSEEEWKRPRRIHIPYALRVSLMREEIQAAKA